MGGLFNSQKTMKLLGMLNSAFQEAAFSGAAHNQQLISDLKDKTKTSRYIADTYGFLVGDQTYDDKWRMWLDIFDKKGGIKPRTAMSNALLQPTLYTGIEFFAVPANTFSIAQTSDLPDQENSGKKTLIVTVDTPVYDVLFQQLKRRRKIKSSKKKSRKKK